MTVSPTYTNLRGCDSCAAYDYGFEAHQGGFALSQASCGGDCYTQVMPGYSTSFTVFWRMRTWGDVSFSAKVSS